MSMVGLEVNGRLVSKDVPDNMLLAEFLRESLGLTGTHVGCDTSQCGCCIVLVDGVSVKSCTVLVANAQDSRVVTVEGLSPEPQPTSITIGKIDIKIGLILLLEKNIPNS